MIKFIMVLLGTIYIWWNLAKWTPSIFTNIFIVGPLLAGSLMIIIGLASSLRK